VLEPTCSVNHGLADSAVVTTQAERQAVLLHVMSETAHPLRPLGPNIFLSFCVRTYYLRLVSK
jgi:hypothetical protein